MNSVKNKYTLEEIIARINKEILSTPKYGFEDDALWEKFKEDNFSRSGEIDGEKYSSKINRVLSGAAVSHTLSHIRLSLSKMEGEG